VILPQTGQFGESLARSNGAAPAPTCGRPSGPSARCRIASRQGDPL